MRQLIEDLASDADDLPKAVRESLKELGDALQDEVPEELHGDKAIPRAALPAALLAVAAGRFPGRRL